MQDTVDAVSDAKIMTEWLEMNISCSLLQSLAQDLIHEFHDRGLGILAIKDIDLLFLDKGLLIASLEQFFKGFRSHTISRLHCFGETTTRGHDQMDSSRVMVGDCLPCSMVEGIPNKKTELVGRRRHLFNGFFRINKFFPRLFGKNLEPKRQTRRKRRANILRRLHLILFSPIHAKQGGQLLHEIIFRNGTRRDDSSHLGLLGKSRAGESLAHGIQISAPGTDRRSEQKLRQPIGDGLRGSFRCQ